MKVLLHIGQSKTGTSAIQAYLTLNRARLAEQGILYPTVKVGGLPVDIGNHNAVADALMGLSRFPYFPADRYFKEFFAEAERINAQLLILSAEHFFGGEPRIWDVPSESAYFTLYRKKLDTLSRYLFDLDTTVLVYLRPQIDWLESAISQTIRISGLISRKQLYQNDEQFFQMIKPLLKYNFLLSAWSEILNPRQIIAIPYERNNLRNNSTIDDFLARAGLNGLDFPYGTVSLEVNSSLTREYVEVKKILNRTKRSKVSERVIIECLQKLSNTGKFSRTYQISTGLSGQVSEFVSDENAEINRRFVAEGMALSAASKARTAIDRPTDQDILQAMQRFDKEYQSISGRTMLIDHALRAFLREHAGPVHSMLHQIKRYQRRILYKT